MATPDRRLISPEDVVGMKINGEPVMATVLSADWFTGEAAVKVNSEFNPNTGQHRRNGLVGTFLVHDLHPLKPSPRRDLRTYWSESE